MWASLEKKWPRPCVSGQEAVRGNCVAFAFQAAGGAVSYFQLTSPRSAARETSPPRAIARPRRTARAPRAKLQETAWRQYCSSRAVALARLRLPRRAEIAAPVFLRPAQPHRDGDFKKTRLALRARLRHPHLRAVLDLQVPGLRMLLAPRSYRPAQRCMQSARCRNFWEKCRLAASITPPSPARAHMEDLDGGSYNFTSRWASLSQCRFSSSGLPRGRCARSRAPQLPPLTCSETTPLSGAALFIEPAFPLRR